MMMQDWYNDEHLEKLAMHENKRKIFLACSGMHTDKVKDLLEKLCHGPEKISIFDSAEFVIPALYIGQ